MINLKQIGEIIKIDEKPIIEVIKISSGGLDMKGNRFKGWGINETRGGEKYLPPINNWYGIGLKVRDKFDDGNNAWLGYKNKEGEYSVAYIGINNLYNDKDKIIEDLNDYIKCTESLQNKLYIEDINIKQNSEKEGELKENNEKCGDGVCVFQNPDFAENNAGYIDISGYQIKIMLMCRVKPNHIRQPESFKECWILNPDEVRPYRILIKKIPISSLTEDINSMKLLLQPDKNFIQNLKSNTNYNSFLKLSEEGRFANYNKCPNSQVNEDDLFVIRLYSSFYYKFITNYIREGKILEKCEKIYKGEKKIFKGFTEEQLKSWIYCLQLALSRNKNVEENTIVYRGVKVKFPTNIGIGTKFYLKEFLSTTTKKEFAEDWIKNKGTIMIITIKNNGTNGHPNYCYYIEDISKTKKQYEVLVSSHCYFTVSKIERGEELDYISLICEGYLFG